MFKIIFLSFILVNSALGQIEIREMGRFGGTGTNHGQFKNPSAIDISEEKLIFVCDRGNNRVQVFNDKGFFIKDIGGFGSKNEQFDEPMDIWAKTTLNIFVADYNNQRVQRFDRELNFISAFYSNEGDDERYQFREVLSVAHSSQGDLFILDAGENQVIKFQRETAKTSFGFFDSGVGELNEPVQIDIMPDEKLIVSDIGNKCVNVYDYFGNFLNRIMDDKMQNPSGLAVDNSGRIYIADSSAKTVFIMNASGELLAQFSSISGKNLDYPVDLCLINKGMNTYSGYLINGDEVIIFTLKYNLSRE